LKKIELNEIWQMIVDSDSKIVIYDKKLYLANLIVLSLFSVEEVTDRPNQFLQMVNALSIDRNRPLFDEYLKVIKKEITIRDFLTVVGNLRYNNKVLHPLRDKALELLKQENPVLKIEDRLELESDKFVLTLDESQNGEIGLVDDACRHLCQLLTSVLDEYQNGQEHLNRKHARMFEASQLLNFFPKKNLVMFLGMEDILSLRLLKNYC
jgi:hypothetical protein